MEQGTKGRLITVFVLFALAVMFMFPSLRYFIQLSNTPLPQREEYKAVEDFDDAMAAYNAKMTNLRKGMWLLGSPMPLGLDLQGGTDVLLSISEDKVREDQLVQLAQGMRREFIADNIDARVALNEAKDGIQVTLNDTNNALQAQLILENYETLQDWDPAGLKTENGVLLNLEPIQVENYKTGAIEGAMETIRSRVDALGVTQPTVVKVGTEYIRVQVPGEKDPQRVVDLVIQPANLEFRIVNTRQVEIFQSLTFDENGEVTAGTIPANYRVMFGRPLEEDNTAEPGAAGVITKRAGAQRDDMIQAPVYIVENEPALTGADLSDARYYYDPGDTEGKFHKVSVTYNKDGARTLSDVTQEHLGEQMAIILEDNVVSAPTLQAHITNGRAVIEGGFKAWEAQDLGLILRGGALPARLNVEQQQTVGATLGTDAVRFGMGALLVGSLLVTIFMIIYYGSAGVMAIMALIVNVVSIFAVLALSKATLTLSGIGGILLTVGMAVDANVLIFERLREESAEGGGIKAILSKGFGKAFSTIWDANLTTLITALVLLQFGTSSMQGFALTMTFGIFATLYTGLFVTRVLADVWSIPRGKISLGAFHIFDKTKIDFLALRKYSYVLSAVLLVMGLAGIIHNKGLNLGADFQGGVSMNLTFAGEEDVQEDAIRGLIPDGRVQKIQDRKNAFIITHKLVDDNIIATNQYISTQLDNSFSEQYTIEGASAVGAAVSQGFGMKALICIIVAALSIFIYVWFRFERAFGGAAVLALFHDIILTFGLLELLEVEITLEVVAALLMVFGYSINDTIVVFDRIRENLHTVFGRRFEDLINISVNQCLSRTVITSVTTLLAVSSMFLMGGEGLHDFSLTLLIGMVIGTYSSSFVATPVLYDWRRTHLVDAHAEAGAAARSVQAATDDSASATSAGQTAPARAKRRSGPKTHAVRVDPLEKQ